jgi:hypothetical protein
MLSMPSYQVYRMRDSLRQQFRWAPHVAGPSAVKPKDYEPDGRIEARNAYEAWHALRESAQPLSVGDLLESQDGQLRICKYVGFEPAGWVQPDPTALQEATCGTTV